MPGLTKGATFAIGTVVVTLAVGGLAYRAWQAVGSPRVGVTAPAQAPTTAAAHTAAARPRPQVKESAVAAPPTRRPALPGFDIVRVEPTGDTVVAGRAAPYAEVALLDKGKVIAETKADANGQFAVIPPPLPAGAHLLALGEKTRSGQVISAQTVTVAVPKSKRAGNVMTALTEPGQPTRLLSPQGQKGSAGGSAQKPGETSAVAIRTVEIQQGGDFFVTGSAPPTAEVRLYLDGSPIAALHAGQDGSWSLHQAKSLPPGSYTVRADQLDAASGRVVARAEVPFDYKASATAEASPGRAARKGQSAKEAVAAAIRRVTVVHGDSLWRISRKVLGRGIRYTEIYAANASQIRNPRLIYPGQVLVTPSTSVN